MMGKLIYADEIMEYLDNYCHYSDNPDYDIGYGNGIYVAWEKLLETPAIDPVHAAGGCYCHECVKANLLDDKNGYYCVKGITMPLNGFCSEGKVREDNG